MTVVGEVQDEVCLDFAIRPRPLRAPWEASKGRVAHTILSVPADDVTRAADGFVGRASTRLAELSSARSRALFVILVISAPSKVEWCGKSQPLKGFIGKRGLS